MKGLLLAASINKNGKACIWECRNVDVRFIMYVFIERTIINWHYDRKKSIALLTPCPNRNWNPLTYQNQSNLFVSTICNHLLIRSNIKNGTSDHKNTSIKAIQWLAFVVRWPSQEDFARRNETYKRMFLFSDNNHKWTLYSNVILLIENHGFNDYIAIVSEGS